MLKREYKIIIVIVLACLLTLSVVSVYSYLKGFEVKKNIIGIISIDDAILSSEDADKIIEAINYAAINDSVKAVVLRVNSPGGYADLVEQIYLDLIELKKS